MGGENANRASDVDSGSSGGADARRAAKLGGCGLFPQMYCDTFERRLFGSQHGVCRAEGFGGDKAETASRRNAVPLARAALRLYRLQAGLRRSEI